MILDLSVPNWSENLPTLGYSCEFSGAQLIIIPRKQVSTWTQVILACGEFLFYFCSQVSRSALGTVPYPGSPDFLSIKVTWVIAPSYYLRESELVRLFKRFSKIPDHSLIYLVKYYKLCDLCGDPILNKQTSSIPALKPSWDRIF